MKHKSILLALFATLITAGLVVAATENRIIEIEGDYAGDLRFGPYQFKNNVNASVQKLKIKSSEASLSAPDKVEMSKAQGKRTATFRGNVSVNRGRMNASGPSLEYKEETGIGALSAPTKVIQKPEKVGDDEVSITSSGASFDVDTDVSTSTGGVKLINGNQSATADKSVFDEKGNLACLTDNERVVLIREPKKAGENKLTINAKEARMLTDKKLLIATGGVTLISGGNKTTGAALYYDDNTSTAYVVGAPGKPATNTNEKTGSSVAGGTIERNINRNQVKQSGGIYAIPFNTFKCPAGK